MCKVTTTFKKYTSINAKWKVNEKELRRMEAFHPGDYRSSNQDPSISSNSPGSGVKPARCRSSEPSISSPKKTVAGIETLSVGIGTGRDPALEAPSIASVGPVVGSMSSDKFWQSATACSRDKGVVGSHPLLRHARARSRLRYFHTSLPPLLNTRVLSSSRSSLLPTRPAFSLASAAIISMMRRICPRYCALVEDNT